MVLASPEELGLVTAAQASPSNPSSPSNTPTDWNVLHARLRHLGVDGFQLRKTDSGEFRVVLNLRQAGRTQQVEVTGASEDAAFQAAVQRAESWFIAQR